MILDATRTLQKSATMSYADTIIGLPTLIICLQVVPFALLFYYAYSIKPYTTLDPHYFAVADSESGIPRVKHYQGGPMGVSAWLALFNPMEFFRDIISTFNMFRKFKMENVQTVMSSDSHI